MLPFLRPKKSASVVSVVTDKSGKSESKGHEGETPNDRMTAAEKLISGLHSKDAAQVCEALNDMHNSLMSANAQKGEPNES